MKPNRAILFLSALMLFLVAVNCECDDGGGVETAAPNVDRFHVGDSETPLPIDQFSDTPESGELSIDFGLIDVDTIGRKYLFFRNGGKSDLILSNVEMNAGSSADFMVACNKAGIFSDCPITGGETLAIPSGADLVFQVSYAPKDVGLDSGSFVIQLNVPDHKTITVNLNGEGVTPEVKVCITECIGDQNGAACMAGTEICNDAVAPDDLQMPFGEVDMDTTLRRHVVITNQGDRPLQISGLSFSTGDFNQFQIDKNGQDLPGILPVGQQAEIFVIYDPGTGGAHSCALKIVSNDVNEREIRVQLSGLAMAPRVCPSPLFLDFGNVASGETLVKTFEVKNCGLLDLNLMNVAMNIDSSSDFTLLNLPGLPLNLPPDQVVNIEVQYAPPSQGTDHGGVDLFSNDPASNPGNNLTGTVALSGQSIPRACDIQATPFAISFGGVVVNGDQTVDLIISNQGTDTCILNDAAITANSANNEFEIVSQPSANTNFDPGDTLVIQVKYHPINLGSDVGTLTLYGNDKDASEIPVDLNGSGVDSAVCDLRVTPTSQNFGMIKVNNTQAAAVVLENRGQEVCSITRLELKQSAMQPGNLEITSNHSLPITLVGGASTQVEITFAPDHPGDHKSYLWLNANDPDLQIGGIDCIWNKGAAIAMGEACISIKGSSAEGTIAVVPAELDFGVVTVGCASPELHVTVYNLGGIALNISSIYLADPGGPFQIRSAPNTPTVINPGSDIELRLRYVPPDTNTHHSTLYIESDASNAPLFGVPLYGRGTNITDQTDVFHQPDQVKSDVLFVIDNSGSMSEEQSDLINNFDSFINHAITLDVDFHIGVITTEVNDAETGQGSPSRDIYPGVLVHPSSRPKIITNTTPNLTDAFTDNANVGTCCSDEQEAGLEAAWMALSPGYIDDPAKNGGFLREDAKLYIILLSDEQDQSAGDPDFYVDFFSSIKGYRNTERMAVSAIVGDSPSGCATADNGSRYIEVANRTGGIFVSICTSNWAQSLQSLGLDAFAAIREFPLSRPADSNSIVVTVNGSTVPKASCNDCDACHDGWVYYPDTNTICFGANYVPEMGDVINVSYTAECIIP
ncbi:MAG: choice-of-anchor D domain-containing protein [Deltaproteobacteria bacterium]|nr:choice-of-anchor D domain-containing protein [Deltaproteobacteria bacterium]